MADATEIFGEQPVRDFLLYRLDSGGILNPPTLQRQWENLPPRKINPSKMPVIQGRDGKTRRYVPPVSSFFKGHRHFNDRTTSKPPGVRKNVKHPGGKEKMKRKGAGPYNWGNIEYVDLGEHTGIVQTGVADAEIRLLEKLTEIENQGVDEEILEEERRLREKAYYPPEAEKEVEVVVEEEEEEEEVEEEVKEEGVKEEEITEEAVKKEKEEVEEMNGGKQEVEEDGGIERKGKDEMGELNELMEMFEKRFPKKMTSLFEEDDTGGNSTENHKDERYLKLSAMGKRYGTELQ